jgi:hypothetical protein
MDKPKLIRDTLRYYGEIELPAGCVVATCELVHVAIMDEAIAFPSCEAFWWRKQKWLLDDKERAFGYFEAGRYMWLLANIKALPEPVPARGMQGLWNFDERLLR